MTTPDDSTGADYTGPDHGFGEDNALADEIMQQDWYDDNPSTHDLSRMGARRLPMPTTVSALPPERREPILKQLVGLTPEQRAPLEAQLVQAAVVAASRDARIVLGVGAGATPLAKAQVNLAYRERDLERRMADWNDKLAEVKGANAITDPATGQTKLVPIPALTPEQRHIAAVEITNLARELGALRGPLGQRELDQALAETVDHVKARRQAATDLAEIDRRARESIREDELNARAATHAKHLRAKSNYSASL